MCQLDLLRASEGLRHAPVASAVAGGDEVGDAAALQEGGGGDGALAEEFGEGHHLHEPQSDDGSFSVVPEAQAVTEARAHRHNVLAETQYSCAHKHTPRTICKMLIIYKKRDYKNCMLLFFLFRTA